MSMFDSAHIESADCSQGYLHFEGTETEGNSSSKILIKCKYKDIFLNAISSQQLQKHIFWNSYTMLRLCVYKQT